MRCSGGLIEQMALENRAEIGDDLRDNAQCAIDILVRNLYERTADVGFLATDDTVREFCAANAESPGCEPCRHGASPGAQYQAKYTVYDDIILLSTTGQVIARLDTRAPADAADAELAADDAVCAVAMSSASVPLRSRHRVQRRCSTRQAVHHGDGRPAGVLVLRFRFEDEMRRIFEATLNGSHRIALTLVDALLPCHRDRR